MVAFVKAEDVIRAITTRRVGILEIKKANLPGDFWLHDLLRHGSVLFDDLVEREKLSPKKSAREEELISELGKAQEQQQWVVRCKECSKGAEEPWS